VEECRGGTVLLLRTAHRFSRCLLSRDEMMGGECGGVTSSLLALHCLLSPFAFLICCCFRGVRASSKCVANSVASPLFAPLPESVVHLTPHLSVVRVVAVLLSPSVLFFVVAFARCCSADRSLALLPVVHCSRRSFRFATRPARCCRCWLLHVVSRLSLVLLCSRRSLFVAAPHRAPRAAAGERMCRPQLSQGRR